MRWQVVNKTNKTATKSVVKPVSKQTPAKSSKSGKVIIRYSSDTEFEKAKNEVLDQYKDALHYLAGR